MPIGVSCLTRPLSERLAELRAGLPPGCRLLAVSKGQPAARIREAVLAGQRSFGESRLQEAAAKQAELDRTLTKQQQTAQRLEQRAVARANDTAANAARLTALIGTPPPEKTAKAPVLGSRRSSATASVGRRALRIDTGA